MRTTDAEITNTEGLHGRAYDCKLYYTETAFDNIIRHTLRTRYNNNNNNISNTYL